jgi:hypothetical protein
VTDVPTKPCAVCGRTITWRKKWERDWPNVKYCSNACRRSASSTAHQQLERAILDLLSQRGPGKSICPSEAAKAVGGPSDDDWRPLMEPARQAARRLVHQGKVEITQKNRVVDPDTAKGPIRIRLNPNPPADPERA